MKPEKEKCMDYFDTHVQPYLRNPTTYIDSSHEPSQSLTKCTMCLVFL